MINPIGYVYDIGYIVVRYSSSWRSDSYTDDDGDDDDDDEEEEDDCEDKSKEMVNTWWSNYWTQKATGMVGFPTSVIHTRERSLQVYEALM